MHTYAMWFIEDESNSPGCRKNTPIHINTTHGTKHMINHLAKRNSPLIALSLNSPKPI